MRSYAAAAPLLLDSLSTFTSYELCTYSSLVVYAVLAGSVSLRRVDFKAKVVDAPEIKAILGDGGAASASGAADTKLRDLAGSSRDAAAAAAAMDAEMADTAADSGPSGSGSTSHKAVNLTTLGHSTTHADEDAAVDFGPLAELVGSLYSGNYSRFFVALGLVEERFLCQDRYLFEHRHWYVREMRLRAYQQLLQSYRVVGLGSMAGDFGVSVDFLDR